MWPAYLNFFGGLTAWALSTQECVCHMVRAATMNSCGGCQKRYIRRLATLVVPHLPPLLLCCIRQGSRHAVHPIADPCAFVPPDAIAARKPVELMRNFFASRYTSIAKLIFTAFFGGVFAAYEVTRVIGHPVHRTKMRNAAASILILNSTPDLHMLVRSGQSCNWICSRSG